MNTKEKIDHIAPSDGHVEWPEKKKMRSLLKQARGSVHLQLLHEQSTAGVGVRNSETDRLEFLLRQIDEIS